MTRKQAIRQAAEAYAQEIEKHFPGVRTEVLLESFDGFDAWIAIDLPPRLHERRPDIMDATVELNFRFDDEGVALTAMVQNVEEEVGAHG